MNEGITCVWIFVRLATTVFLHEPLSKEKKLQPYCLNISFKPKSKFKIYSLCFFQVRLIKVWKRPAAILIQRPAKARNKFITSEIRKKD